MNLGAMRREIVKSATLANEGHIPSALSILEIVATFYSDIMNVELIRENSPDRDRFILSKGHGSLALYSVLAEVGLMDPAELARFCSLEGILGGHPDRCKVPCVEASTGSLGHGLPMATGLAMSLKRRSSSARVYVLVGDGECNEGSIWEATMLASHMRLANLLCVVDYNHSGDRALELGDLVKKFEAFGWSSVAINGHDQLELATALKKVEHERPVAVIANTIKGYGLKEMENNPAWHHAAPSAEQLTNFIIELDENA